MGNTTSKVSRSDIKKSTTRTGCVDLGKIRNLRDERKKKRSDGLKAINEKKAMVVEHFQAAYKDIIGGAFKLRGRTSFTSWKDKSGKVYKKRNATDKQRLWEAYKRAEDQNGASVDDMLPFFKDAIFKAQERYTINSSRQIFGYVVNEGVIDTWFMNLSKRRSHQKANEKIDERAKSHAELFNR